LPVALLAVNTTLSPAQKVVGPPAEIVGVGRGLTVTPVVVDAAEQPFPSVTVTEYEPVAVTVIDCVVSPPGDHTLPVTLLEVKTTLSPEQKIVGPPAVIVGVGGSEFTVTTVAEEVPVQPLPSVTETE